MRNITINLIKTILAILLAPFFIIFSTINELFKSGAQMFDDMVEILKAKK